MLKNVSWEMLYLRKLNLIIKRGFDIFCSAFGIVVLLPVFALIAIAIKGTSNGPVFFVQERLGKNGEVFKILKFRTMVLNAESIGDGLFVYAGSDSRITKIGGVLRKTSMDELPQLLNVLKGDMSLVGPRPPVTYFPYNGYEAYPEWAVKRFQMKPGMTGLVQIRTRATIPWDDRILIDNEYIDAFSVLLDIKILWQTFLCVLFRKNIYPETKEQINNSDSLRAKKDAGIPVKK